MMKRTFFGTVPLLLVLVAGVAHAGSLSPSASPAPTMHTLTDIYTRLTTNAASTEGDHSFTAPGSVSGTQYTLEQVYDAIPTIDPSKVLAGTTYLGIDGTVATRTPSAATGSFPAGFYNAFNLSAIDADLIAANIVDGVNIFGIIGTAAAEGSWVGTATSLLDMSGFDIEMSGGDGSGGGNINMDGGVISMPSNSFISDGTYKSVDPYNRTLTDSSNGYTAVDWGSRKLYASNGGTVALDWSNPYALTLGDSALVFGNANYISDGSQIAIDPYYRTLTDGSNGYTAVDWGSRKLYASNGTTVALDWSNPYNLSLGDANLVFSSLNKITDGSQNAIDPYNRTLNDTSGSAVLNWANGYLEMGTSTIYGNGTLSIDPYNKQLYDGGVLAADWYGSEFDIYKTLEMDNGADIFMPSGSTITGDGSTTAIDPYNRKLVASNGSTVMGDWGGSYFDAPQGFAVNGTSGYTGDLNDSTHTKIADVVGGIITAVYSQ